MRKKSFWVMPILSERTEYINGKKSMKMTSLGFQKACNESTWKIILKWENVKRKCFYRFEIDLEGYWGQRRCRFFLWCKYLNNKSP